MTATQQFDTLFSKMSPNEKALIYRKITGVGTDIFPGIEKTQGVCGGSACIIRTRIPVWTLVSYKNLGLSDEKLLENYPTLRRQDLANAWHYFLANPSEIELEIRENDEA